MMGGPVFGDIISHHDTFQHFVLTGRVHCTTQLCASCSCLVDDLLPIKARDNLFCEVPSQDRVLKELGRGTAGNTSGFFV